MALDSQTLENAPAGRETVVLSAGQIFVIILKNHFLIKGHYRSSKLPRSQAQKRLVANWINIVLTIISVTQGVAAGSLLNHFPNTFNFSIDKRSYVCLALFLLCIVISVRIFQTIITGVIEEEFTMPNLYELSLVFIVVSAEYYLFSLFAKETLQDVKRFLIIFYEWAIVLCIIGVLGYSMKVWRLKRRYKQRRRKRDNYYYTELWLQRRNIFGMFAVMAIQSFILAGILYFPLEQILQIFGQILQISLILLTIVFLFANINYSLRSTFGEGEQMSRHPTQLLKPEGEELELKIVAAKAEDATELRNLLMQHFGYVYKTLFVNGKKDEIAVSKMMESVLKAFGGKHALGYKSFYVAYPKGNRREIVGMLMLNGSAEGWRRFMTGFIIIKLLFLNFGLKALFRFLRNWQVVQNISQKVKDDELHIAYLAVNADARKRKVGKQLLEHARQIGKKKRKKLITLDVREKNSEAQSFFIHNGCEIIPNSKPNDEADSLLGQGTIIRMICKI